MKDLGAFFRMYYHYCPVQLSNKSNWFSKHVMFGSVLGLEKSIV